MLPPFPPRRMRRASHLYGLPFLLLAGTLAACHRAWIEGMFNDGLCYIALARNAADHGHWLVPHLSGHMFDRFFEHPPTLFIYVGAVFQLVGASWTAARLAMLPFTLGALVLLWRGLRPEAGRRVAFLGCAALVVCVPWMRWSRMPNLDTPVAVLCGFALFAGRRGLTTGRFGPWLVAGAWLGLALLMKGWFACCVPLALLGYGLWAGHGRAFLTLRPWAGLAVAAALFAIWPLALYSAGEISGFQAYVASGFAKADAPGVSPWKLLGVLFTKVLPQTLFAILGVRWLIGRTPRDHVGWLLVAWCLAVLVPLQILGGQHGHWLLVMYPALAGLAGFGLVSLGRTWSRRLVHATWVGVPAAAIVLAILPLGISGHRDREIYDTLAYSRTLTTPPDEIALVDGSVPTWRFLSAHALLSDIPEQVLAEEGLTATLDGPPAASRRLVIVRAAWREGLSKARRAAFEARYAVIRAYPRTGVLGVVDRRLLVGDPLFRRE